MLQVLQYAAHVATILGLLSVVVAVIAFNNSIRQERDRHVNTLFREMLTLELQYYDSIASAKADNRGSESEIDPETIKALDFRNKFMLHKFWVLEEFWKLLEHKKREIRYTFSPFRKRHREMAQNWENAIRYHLSQMTAHDLEAFETTKGSYILSFQTVVSEFRAKEDKEGGARHNSSQTIEEIGGSESSVGMSKEEVCANARPEEHAR